MDRHTVIAPEPLGEPEVVAVAVDEDDALDIVHRSAHIGEFGLQVVPVSGHARVDDGHSFVRVDEVGGHDVVADARRCRRCSQVA
jgi:hypothetical protein